MQTIGTQLLLLAGGLCAGLLGGFLGIGGGIVLMPLLRFLVELPPAAAAGTCVIAVFCTTVGGSYRHVEQGHLRVASVVPTIICGALASALCSMAFGQLARRGHWLDLGIGLVFCVVSLRMIGAGRSGTTGRGAAQLVGQNVVRAPLPLKAAVGAVAGGLPGLLGIGSGAILVPAFTLLMRAPVRTAMAASLTCFAFAAAISSAFKLAQGYVVLVAAIPLCLGTLLGANIGAVLNRRFDPRVLQLAFGVLFFAVSARFIASFCGVSS